MALLSCEFFSKVMDMATAVRVILPEEGELGEVPVVYLLHGLSDNCTGWTRYTSIERYARERGIAVVMPEVQRSWYCDMDVGLPYFRYISEELPQLCQRFFGLSSQREKNYVFGLSMGGFGAMKTALTFPERYAGAGSFSGAVGAASMVTLAEGNPMRQRELTAILGPDHEMGPENDLAALAAKAEFLPGLYLSCGEEDFLYPDNQEFHARLTELGIDHRYDHRPGCHSWEFWDQSVRDCLAYFFD